MVKIPFNVSSRTAILIGRENIANSESAIVELVKNCYDADANISLLLFDIKYDEIPRKLAKSKFELVLSYQSEIDKKLLLSYYELKDSYYNFKESNKMNSDLIWNIFNNYNFIYIIDNGVGMTEDVIKQKWMTIGTDFKKIVSKSDGGRVYTGAKGIGRFSLDKLGESCEMLTISNKNNKKLKWIVNWTDFEKDNQALSDVKANLEIDNSINYSKQITGLLGSAQLSTEVDLNTFKFGTIFKISGLRNKWSREDIGELYNNLEILIPPTDIGFKIYLMDLNNKTLYGEINNSICDDFDYKIEAVAKSKNDVSLKIFRNELDLKKINDKLFDIPDMKKPPFDKKTINSKFYELKTNFSELVPGYDDENIFDQIGPFIFTFYFLKRSGSKDQHELFQKSVRPSQRSEWLNRFGGIKIFRDNFRVKPYGDPNRGYFDWLELGKRVTSSPSGITHQGRWRVRPNQITGVIQISRLSNVNFNDKASREGLQDVREFEVFKNIIISIIQKFEIDRQTIGRSIKAYWKKENEIESNKMDANELAKKIIEEEEEEPTKKKKSSAKKKIKNKKTKFSNTEKTLAKAINTYQNEIRDTDESLRLLRVLASTGLVITSFSHELQNLKSSILTRTGELKDLIENLIPKDKLKNIPDHLDPYILINDMRSSDEKIYSWLKFSLNSIKKDKRERNKINFYDYYKELYRSWEEILAESDIKLQIPTCDDNYKCFLKAYPMDLDAIFVNLISNSVNAFREKRCITKDKIIDISLICKKDRITIKYSDNGPGLNPSISLPESIFEPFESTKVDRYGKVIGTGLGMWILKITLEEYDTKYELKEVRKGFELEIIFLTNKDEGVYKNDKV